MSLADPDAAHLAAGTYTGAPDMRAFAAYAHALMTQRRREEVYRVLVTETARGMAKALGIDMGTTYAKLTAELERRPKPRDDRSGDEIALDIITRMGLEVTNEPS